MLVRGRGQRAEGPTEEFEVSSTRRDLSRMSVELEPLMLDSNRPRSQHRRILTPKETDIFAPNNSPVHARMGATL